MTAYCSLEDVKSSLSGDAPNMGASFDQSLVDRIVQVSRDIDRKVAYCRGESMDVFSFLASQRYGRQVVYLSSSPPVTSGTFVLAYDGEITGPIPYDADGSSVQVQLELLAGVGVGNVSVTGFAGGPWTVGLAGALDGPRPTLTGRTTTDPAAAAIVVLPAVTGTSLIMSERVFHSVSPLYGGLLVIDDCVELGDVYEISGTGAHSAPLVENVDFRRFPLRGLPTYALKKTGAPSSVSPAWGEWPLSYGVVARWGYALEVPEDVRETTVLEVIRAHFSAQANNDDRLGLTPFGKVITSKAWTSKTQDLVESYANKLW